jgi:formiminotetrahydrofolate cyclodeaminase
MDLSFKEMKLKDFIDTVASSAPTPGGGTVAALCGVQAVALVQMVYSLTIGKKCFSDVPETQRAEFIRRADDLPELATSFYRFMEEDSVAFTCVMDAFKMPKSCEEEKFQRSCAIQSAYIQSAEVPHSVAKLAVTLYPYIRLAAEYGNPNAASDAGVSALLAHAAVEGATMNVRINTLSMKDRERAKLLETAADDLLEISTAQKDEIAAVVYSKISQ